MFCPYCGETMEPDAVFCPRCGERIPSGASEKASPFRHLDSAPPVDMGRSRPAPEDEHLVRLAGYGRRVRRSAVLPVILTICAVVSFACVVLLVGNALRANGLLPKAASSPAADASSANESAGAASGPSALTSTPTNAALTAKVLTKRPALLESLSTLEVRLAEASSSYGMPEDSYYHGPAFAVDKDFLTSWQEGADGNGKGESLTLHLSKKERVRALALHLGNWRDEDAYYANHRPKTLTLRIGGEKISLSFKDVFEVQYVVLSKPVRAESLILVLNKCYPGTETTDNCISEVEVFGW